MHSPLELITKQKNDAPSQAKENLKILEDLMNNFYYDGSKGGMV